MLTDILQIVSRDVGRVFSEYKAILAGKGSE
jgi:hypothetical protein